MTDAQFEVAVSTTGPLEDGRYPGFRPARTEYPDFVRYTDQPVLLRDGTKIFVDIFRPLDEAIRSPTLVAWSPYGKHGLKNLGMMPGADVDPSWVSEHAIWEGPDPAFWCPRGYTIISPDPRGAWASDGTLTFFSRQEGDDGHDVIEWIAAQEWSNGKVGMLGVSYLAISQWFIAATRPPSLAAICPWEGLSDPYREVYFHGGIPEEGFLHWWQPKSRWSTRPAEDIIEMTRRHPLLDAYWQTKTIDLEQIEVPALVVASWGDQGMHTRGTLEAFRRIGSHEKWLMVHGQKKWKSFYEPSSVARQLAFFDHYLRGAGRDTLDRWPRVQIEVRESNDRLHSRSEPAWPLEGVEPLKLYLDPAMQKLGTAAPAEVSQIAYDSAASGGKVAFEHVFEHDTEITGSARLHLVMTADEADEIDVFVAFRKLDRDGREVGFRYYSTFSDGPAALGWLRGTHRGLLPASTELQPVHDHQNPIPIVPGERVDLDVEIWPSSVLYRAGERLQLVIAGSDIYNFDTGAPELRHATRNAGINRIYSGPRQESYLLLPRVLPRER